MSAYYDRCLPEPLFRHVRPGGGLDWLPGWLRSPKAVERRARVEFRRSSGGHKDGALMVYMGRTRTKLLGEPADGGGGASAKDPGSLVAIRVCGVDLHVPVWAGAPEWCDGVQQDCANTAWHDDAGVATWVAGSGESSDLTPTLAQGEDYAPIDLPLTESGGLQVCAGTWYVSIDVAMGVHVTISDPTASGLAILDGGDVAQVLQIEDGETTTVASASDVTFTRGRSEDDGGCVEVGSGAEVNLTRVQIVDCTAADRGGGFAAITGDTRIEIADTTVSGCASGTQGGGMMFGGDEAWWSSDTTLQGVELSENTAGGNGGGILLNGHTARMSSLSVHGNYASGWGGGIGMAGSEVELLDSTLTGNSAGAEGGGFYAGGQTTVTITRTVVSENSTTDSGGGAWVEGSICALIDSSLFDNTATVTAGGLDLAYDSGVSSAYNRASCTGSSLSDSLGFAGNRDGEDMVEVRVRTGTTFSATECDWQGAEGGPGAVLSEATGTISSWGLDATFECGDSGCF